MTLDEFKVGYDEDDDSDDSDSAGDDDWDDE